MTQAYTIERGRTKIKLNEGKLVVAHPCYGPNTAVALRNAIRADGLREPTAAKVASFLHVAYNGNEPEFREATEIMKSAYFRTFTGVLYDPAQNRIVFTDTPEFDANGRVSLDALLARTGDNDPTFRTIPLTEVMAGWKTSAEVKEDAYMVALAGREGAAKLANLAERYPSGKAYLWLPTLNNKPEARIASLDSYCCDGDWLNVSGGDGLGRGSRAFGVFPDSGEAGVRKT